MRNLISIASGLLLSATAMTFTPPAMAQDGGTLLPALAQCAAVTPENRDYCCGADMRVTLPPELENICRGGSPDDESTNAAVGTVSGETTGSIGANSAASTSSGAGAAAPATNGTNTGGGIGNPGNSSGVGAAGEQPGNGGFGGDGVTGKSGGNGKGRN